MALKVGELYASFGIDQKELDSTLNSIESKCNEIASSLAKTGGLLSASLTTPLVAMSKSALQTGMDFDAQMSRVQGISGATAEEFAALREAAIQMGADSVFGALDAAQALEYMGMAGWKSEQMLAGLPGIINLAAASGEDLGTVSDIVTDALTAFGLTAEDASHFADVLAKASATANTNVSMLGESFKYVAPVAGALGYSVEDVSVALGLMANAGIKASQGGTSLRASLSKLIKPTEDASVIMDEFGICLSNSDGSMKSLNEVMVMLRSEFGDLNASQQTYIASTLFGQEAMSGMLAIINASEEDFNKLTDAIANSADAATTMSDVMVDNLKGDIEEFNGEIEQTSILFSDILNPALRSSVQKATRLAGRFNALGRDTQEMIFKVAGLAAATGPAMLGMSGLVAAAGQLVPVMSALVSPIGVVSMGIGLLATAAIDADNDIGTAFASISGDIKLSLRRAELSVGQAIKTVSGRIPALSASVISGLNNIIPAVIDLGSQTASSLLDAIADNSDVLADIGLSVVTNVADGISRNLPKLAVSGVNIVTSIATSLISNAPELLRSAGSLAHGMAQAFFAVDWLDVGSQIITSIGEAGEDMAGIIEEWKTKAEAAVIEAGGFKAIGLSIVESIKGGIHAAGGWLKAAIMGEAGTEATWADVGQVILAGIQNSLSGIGSWISGKIDEGRALAAGIDWSSIWSNISTTAATLKGKAFTIADNIVTWIGEKLGSISSDDLTETLGDLSSVATGIIDSIISSKTSYITEGGELVGKLIDGIGDFNGWEAFGTTFTTIADSLIDGIVSGIDSVGDVAVLILGKIGGLLSGDGTTSALGSMTNVATEIITSIADEIPSLSDTAEDIIVAIGDTIEAIPWSTVAGECANLALGILDGVLLGLENLGTDGFADIVSAVGDGIVAAASGLGTAAGTLVGEFVAYVVKPENLLEIGKIASIWIGEIVKGMFSLGGSMFESAARFLSNTLVGTMRGIFGAEVDPYVERLMQDFFSTEFEVPTDTFDGMGKVCGTALYEAMLSPFANTESLENAIAAWGVAVQTGYSSVMPEFEFLGNESIRTLSAAMLTSIESGAQDMTSVTEQAALLVATGYADGLIGGFYVNQPGIYDAMSALLDENTIDLSTLASTHGYDIGSIMGVSIPEGYSFALKNGYFAITDATGQFIYEAERTIEDGWTIDSVMAALWEAAMNDSLAVITGEDRTSLINELKSFGVEAGDILGLALPEGIAAGLAAGEIDVHEAAKLISEAAKLAQPEVDSVVADAKSQYEDIAQGGADGLTSKETTVSDAATGISDAVTDTLSPLPADLTTLGGDAATGMADGITGGQDQLKTAAQTAATAAAQEFQLNLSTEHGNSLGTGWIAAISNGMSSCITTLEGVANSIGESTFNLFKSWLSNMRGSTQGREIMYGIQSGMNSAASGVSSSANNIARNVVNTFKNTLSSSAGSSLGYNFDAGIAQGIQNGSGMITSAARSAANAALRAAKNALDIHSPSGKAEKEVGNMFDEGAAKGILGNMGVIIAASKELGKEMLASMLVGDPSHGTVLSSKSAAREAAAQTAHANGNQNEDNAERIGRAIADRLIEAGILDGDILMDGEKVGEKVSGTVSKTISRKSKTTITGRAALAMR